MVGGARRAALVYRAARAPLNQRATITGPAGKPAGHFYGLVRRKHAPGHIYRPALSSRLLGPLYGPHIANCREEDPRGRPRVLSSAHAPGHAPAHLPAVVGAAASWTSRSRYRYPTYASAPSACRCSVTATPATGSAHQRYSPWRRIRSSESVTGGAATCDRSSTRSRGTPSTREIAVASSGRRST